VRRRLCFQLIAACVLASAVAVPRSGLAQERTASLPAVTAEYLLRFARFTEWPAEALPPDAPLVVCTTDPLVAQALTETPGKQTVSAHAVSAQLVHTSAIPRECNVLHLADLDGKKTTSIIAALPNRYVLTVGDSEVFTRSGGVIQVYIEEDRLRFVINLAAAERARLRLSSKMLVYGRIVRE